MDGLDELFDATVTVTSSRAPKEVSKSPSSVHINDYGIQENPMVELSRSHARTPRARVHTHTHTPSRNSNLLGSDHIAVEAGRPAAVKESMRHKH